MGNNKLLRSILKTIAKVGFSAFFLYLVFRKINFQDLLMQMQQTNLWWILPAALLFILSKLISSIRLNYFFRSIGLEFKEEENLRLYWLGMYYNMFLPGGIGGDGYKVYLLSKQYGIPARKVFWAVFLDRVSGLSALLVLSASAALFIFPQPWIKFVIIGALLLGGWAYYYVYKRFFPEFMDCFRVTNYQGLLVQFVQVICALCIMKAVHINDHYLEYALLFLVSSVVAIFPFTIGGLGARELTFVYGSQFLLLDQHGSVVISFWFYMITLFVSLMGIVYVFNPPIKLKAERPKA